MAWTEEKNALLDSLIYERVKIDHSYDLYSSWNLSRTFTKILNAYTDEKQRQQILNDLIDDKNMKLTQLISFQNQVSVNTMNEQTNLIANK